MVNNYIIKRINLVVNAILLISLAVTIYIQTILGAPNSNYDYSFFATVANIKYLIIIFTFLSYIFKVFIGKYTSFQVIIISVIYVIVLVVSFITDFNSRSFDDGYSLYLLMYYSFVVACADIDYRIIIRMIFIAMIYSYIVILIMVLLKNLNNDIIYRSNTSIRYTLGFHGGQEFSYAYLYIIMYYLYLRSKNIMYKELILLSVLNVMVYYFSNVRSVAILDTILVLLVFYSKQVTGFAFKKVYYYILVLFSICLPMGVVLITVFYNSEVYWMRIVNSVLSNRLIIAQDILSEFGIKPFGNYVEYTANIRYYTVIDSSYLIVLINYGIIIFALFIVLLLYFSYFINKKKDTIMFFLLLITIIHMTFCIDIFYFRTNFLFFILSYKNLSIENGKHI